MTARFAHRFGRLVIICGALAFGFPVIAAAQSQQWVPTGTVEFIAATNAGGALDRLARSLQSIIQDTKLAAVPITIINKPGARGAAALTYLNRSPGDGHSILVTSASLLLNDIMGQSGLKYTDMVPIAQLFHEYAVLVVGADSPIRDGKDFVARLRTAPDSISIGLSQIGGHHHISIALAAKAAGADPKRLKVVTFKSGTDALVATLGGHVDASVSSASNILSAVETGQVRAIAVSAPKRLTGRMAKIATWRELGLDSVTSNVRLVSGSRGLSDAQIAYWNQIFFKATSTEAWDKYVNDNAWVAGYLDSVQTKKALAIEYDTLKGALSDLGMVK